jgi:hypothetical protein
VIAGKQYIAVTATQLPDGNWRLRLLTMGKAGRDSRTVHLFDTDIPPGDMAAVLQYVSQAAHGAALDVGNTPHVRL